MAQGSSSGNYAPLEATAPLEEEEEEVLPLAEATAIPEQYVEVRAPADLQANSELTVHLDGSSLPAVVLVVRACSKQVFGHASLLVCC